MAVVSETLQVTGIRCERCVLRLGGALGKLDGLESANANLLGQVVLSWDDERVRRDEIVAVLERAGFRQAASLPE
ncbi:MAG TPA: heavy-metal-associated domain-containing protein [Gaiellaceae bacterium]|nr:heavy-metal-associated domain-containing protein [Gaiellaceae bacterium]